MEKHTFYMTQNALDFLGCLSMGQATVMEEAFIDRLMMREGLSREDAETAATEAFIEVHTRVQQFRSKELFK
jgi:hypothetical protein